VYALSPEPAAEIRPEEHSHLTATRTAGFQALHQPPLARRLVSAVVLPALQDTLKELMIPYMVLQRHDVDTKDHH
jgi:hypothetical protein